MKGYEIRKIKFIDSLNESYRYLCGILKCEPKGRISSWLDVALYYLAVDQLETENGYYDKAADFLSDIGKMQSDRDLIVVKMDKDNINREKYRYLKEVYKKPDEDKNDHGTYKFGAFKGSKEDFTLEQNSIHQALILLKKYQHNYYHKITTLIEEFLVCGKLDNGFMRSSTTVRCFGCVVNTALTKGNVGQYIEDLVHESAHLELYLIQLDDPLVLNDKESTYKAPFRPDSRPMYGIYHAMYVLAHIIKCLNGLRSTFVAKDTLGNLDFLIGRAKKRFDESYSIVDQYSVLTEKGRHIKNSMHGLVVD